MSCQHCGLPLPPRHPRWQEHDFCCAGCLAVYRFIHESGLQCYYDFRETPSGRPVDEVVVSHYSAEQWRNLQVDGAFYFLLEGLHCAACVWLIERALKDFRIEVNFALARLKVEATPEQAEEVRRRVAQLGYTAIPYDPRLRERPRRAVDRSLLLRMAVAGCCAGNIMLLAFALYAGASQEATFRHAFHYLSLLLCLPVMLYSARPFWQGALNSLRHGALTSDVPVAVGLGVTFSYSVLATIQDAPHVYFDTAATFVFVLLVGRNLEGAARTRAGSVVERMLALVPSQARRWDGQGFVDVSVDELQLGDRVEVLPGQKLPGDGRVLEGQSRLDISALTGESLPEAVGPGHAVLGGSLNHEGRLVVLIEKTGEGSLMGQVRRFLESAEADVGPRQRSVDRVARFFLAIAIVAAALTYVAWEGHPQAWYYATTVLIITCPCALGIATPLVVSSVCGRGAGRGILFRGGRAVETGARLTHILLDKTGTLTQGQMQVSQVESLHPDFPAARLLRIAASAEAAAHHPIARALLQAYEGELDGIMESRQLPGQGLEATLAGELKVRLGSPEFLGWLNPPQRPQDTCIAVEVSGRAVGWIFLSDPLRREARAIVERLKAHYQLAIASGDRLECVASIAEQLGIEEFQGRCSPLDKAAWVERLQAQGACVAVVGDGINDAPALQAADLGIVVERASDLSAQAADVVLLRDGLQALEDSLRLARLAEHRLHLNFALAALYNLLAIPAAALGWVTPLVAAISMPISSLAVTLSSITFDWIPGGSRWKRS